MATSFPSPARRPSRNHHSPWTWPADAGAVPTLAVEIVALAPVALLLASTNGLVWLVNRRAEELFERSAEAMRGMALRDLLVSDVGGGTTGVFDGDAHPGVTALARARRGGGGVLDVAVVATGLPARQGRWTILAIHERTGSPVTESTRHALLDARLDLAGGLEDQVIRHLFAAGMAAQGALGMVQPEVAERLRTVVDELDGALVALRDLLFPPCAVPLDDPQELCARRP